MDSDDVKLDMGRDYVKEWIREAWVHCFPSILLWVLIVYFYLNELKMRM